jgi:hypothetical protein
MNMKEVAFQYADNAMAVFPCNPLNKQPMTPHGFKDASFDPDQIAKWWKSNPNAMVGYVTGAVNREFVLDINSFHGKHGALSNLHWLQSDGYVPENATFTETPKGYHVWFPCPLGVEIRNRGKLLEGIIDCVRGEGGYVIAPGSVNSEGGVYVGEGPFAPFLVSAPQKLIDLITSK